MGNAPSSRRSGQIQQPASEHPPPRHGSILGRLNPAAAVSAGRERRYPSHQMPINGLYLTRIPQGLRSIWTSPAPAPSASAAPHVPPFTGHQAANTIRNDVNVKKATLRLEKDEANPGHHLVAFSLDATLPGSVCIFFLAKEGANCSLTPVKRDVFRPVQENFDKGFGQIFRQKSGTGVNLSLFDEDDLSKEGEDEVYALVIRTETVPTDPPPDAPSRSNEKPGAPLPQWINCQTTHAVIEYKEGEYNARVVKQIIWVHGTRYELQEIYGIDNSSSNGGFDGNDSGKECVICMSEPRDTTVLPCRHMCMCSECAKVLRFQTNRCPICRCPVERLLEIRRASKNQV